MKLLILFLLPSIALASPIAPTPFPVFLKSGFSSVLEFEEAPIRVVLGDGQSFQVERVDKSVVVRTLTPYAATNMFVYFRELEPRLFVLTASEDANPTYYKKFETLIIPKPSPPALVASQNGGSKTGVQILRKQFDDKKDYFVVGFEISADSSEILKPNWGLIRLKFNNTVLMPYKLWSERKEVQKDTRVRARVLFAKPNLPRDLVGVSLVIPLQGKASPFVTDLKGVK